MRDKHISGEFVRYQNMFHNLTLSNAHIITVSFIFVFNFRYSAHLFKTLIFITIIIKRFVTPITAAKLLFNTLA